MLEARMVRRTNLEVADIIEAFVEGTGRDWDWDDFCSLKIENRELDAIRLKCINLSFTHPPPTRHRYCNEEGIQLLRAIVKDLRKLPEQPPSPRKRATR
jgi:hypothetical protein